MKIIDSVISFDNRKKDSIFDEIRSKKEKSFWQKVGEFLHHHNEIDYFFDNNRNEDIK